MNEDMFSPANDKPDVPVGQVVTGSVLVIVGVGRLLAALDIASVPWRALLAGILIVIGIGLVAAAARGNATGGLVSSGVALVVILALLSTASAALPVPRRGGIGERDFTPTALTLETEYRLIAGELHLDLTAVEFPEGETRIEASVTFGSLIIDGVAADIAISVEATATAGEIVLFGSTRSGVGLSERARDEGIGTATQDLIIEAPVGFGQIEVTR